MHILAVLTIMIIVGMQVFVINTFHLCTGPYPGFCPESGGGSKKSGEMVVKKNQ